MGEPDSYAAAIGRPDRDYLIVAIGLVRSTANSSEYDRASPLVDRGVPP